MKIRARLNEWIGPFVRRHESVHAAAARAETLVGLVRHTLAPIVPAAIGTAPRSLTVAITAHCNLRCAGCRYGRDFMPGRQLSLETVRNLLDDAKEAGVETVRLYGGEPLLHPRLPEMVRHAVGLGLRVYVTTNAILLKEKVDALVDAGLRDFTIGFYGDGARYDGYVQRRRSFERLEEGIATVRARFGERVSLRMNWLLMRPTCSVESFGAAWGFATRYAMPIQVDLIHYSLPYFSEGPGRMLQFRPEDRPAIERVVEELLRRRDERPDLLPQSARSLRSIPDWLVKGSAMRVPCDRYEMIWVGADGTVQLCYVTFRLGNLHERRLSEMLLGDAHRRAARDCFAVRCPNCHCGYAARVDKHLPSRRQYA